MANSVVVFLNNQAANGIYKSITKFSLFFQNNSPEINLK